MNLRLLICGDRYWTEISIIKNILASIGPGNIDLVIEGGQRGADYLARCAAWSYEIPVLEIAAEWDRLGKFAGPIRNTKMLKVGKPTHIVAFHNSIGTSKGTKDMLEQGRRKRIPCRLVSERLPIIPPIFWETKGGFFS